VVQVGSKVENAIIPIRSGKNDRIFGILFLPPTLIVGTKGSQKAENWIFQTIVSG